MKINKLILASTLISILSLSAIAASDKLQSDSSTTGQANQNMPMKMQGNMTPGSGGNSAMPMNMMKMGSEDGMPMMKMMKQRSAEMKQHREQMNVHLANIENSLQQLVELQKTK